MIRLTRQQVREVDRLAIEKYQMPGIILMENAARGAAEVAERMLRGLGWNSALVLCGGGNNGGDGLAIARHLHNRGFQVRIGLLIDPAKYAGDAQINWRIVLAMKLPTLQIEPDEIREANEDLLIDAIFGTGLTAPPRPPFGELAEAVNQSGKPVLAIDLPSGLDCDTGEALGTAIRATETVTFVAEKAGFANPASKAYTGLVTVADIGCPSELIDQVRE